MLVLRYQKEGVLGEEILSGGVGWTETPLTFPLMSGAPQGASDRASQVGGRLNGRLGGRFSWRLRGHLTY